MQGRSLVLNVTNCCNFRCKTCLRGFGRSSNISLDVVARVLPEFKKLGCKKVAFTGGEPCLHPDFERLVDIVAEQGFFLRFVSNGSLIESYKFLLDKYKGQISSVWFSLDSHQKEVQDSIRDRGSFDKVLAAIGYFVARNVYTGVQMCINKLNYNDLEGVYQLAKQLKVSELLFSSAISTPWNKSIVLSIQEKMECLKTINILKNRNNLKVTNVSSVVGYNGVDFCPNLNLQQLTINPKNELVLCCDTIADGAVIGSLEDQSVLDLYIKSLDISNSLKKVRAQAISAGNITPWFYTCEFCNQYLASYIK